MRTESDLRGEFLDDFYSECDELLDNIRTQLTQLDAACRGDRADPAALEALYRHVHSLKGISAMVELREAEELAHAAEGLLRHSSRGEQRLTPSQLDLLGAVTRRLEQIVSAHRLQQPLPTGTDLIALLNQYDPPRVEAPRPASGATAPEAAPESSPPTNELRDAAPAPSSRHRAPDGRSRLNRRRNSTSAASTSIRSARDLPGWDRSSAARP